MDVLTHLFLPIAVVYAVRPDCFPSPWYFALALFAILPDFDKLLGIPGLLHSVFAVAGIGIVALVVERRLQNTTTYAALITVLLASRLFLDFLDGGPVTVLYPIIKAGVGLEYPTQIVFGDATHDVTVQNPVPRVQVGETNASRDAYSLLNGYGFLSALAFLIVYLGSGSRTHSEGRKE